MAPKRGLGRGLNMLIPSGDGNPKNDEQKKSTNALNGNKNTSGNEGKTDVNQETKKGSTSSENTESQNDKNDNHKNGIEQSGTGNRTSSTSSTKSKKKESKDKVGDILEIDIQKIEPNHAQPRTVFDEDAIEELADSVKQFGVLQPLLVQKRDGFYEIIAGERRWRAAKKAGLKKLPVIVREYDERETLKISLIENIQREGLNAIEEAKAYEQLKKEYGLKQDEIAQSVSKSRTVITNTMRLLKLDDRVQKMILDNLISSGHGRTLLSLENKEQQFELATKILDENISVRETEKMVKHILEHKEEKDDVDEEKQDARDEMMSFFENRMKEIIGSKVTIKEKKNNKGRIEIEYYSKDELERIIDMIQSIEH